MDNVDSRRTEILGIAVIMVLCVHFISIARIPEVLRKILGFGSAGIYVFAFLSGRGLTKSLIKNKSIHLKEFYRRRILKVGLPYLIISAIWLTIRWIIIEFRPQDFILDITTISFWTSHRGAWYLAFLIPVYILFPFYSKWVSVNKKRVYYVLICIILLLFVLFCLNTKLYRHLSQVLCALCAVVLGTYSVYIEGEMKTEKVCLAVLMLLSALIFIPFIKNGFTSGLSMIALGVLIPIIAGAVFSRYKLRRTRRILCYLGNISLEMYLLNIYLLQTYVLMRDSGFAVNENVMYVIVVILGIVLARVFSLLEKYIIRVWDKRNLFCL